MNRMSRPISITVGSQIVFTPRSMASLTNSIARAYSNSSSYTCGNAATTASERTRMCSWIRVSPRSPRSTGPAVVWTAAMGPRSYWGTVARSVRRGGRSTSDGAASSRPSRASRSATTFTTVAARRREGGAAREGAALEALDVFHALREEQGAEQAAGEVRREVLGVCVHEAHQVALEDGERPPHRVALAQGRSELRQQLVLL